MLIDQIYQIATSPHYSSEIARKFLARATEGNLTRDEESASHFCVYFLPYNPKTEQVFIVHHKKSGLWLAPGGHIDKGELLLEALMREMKEELGVNYDPPTGFEPFLLTITPIENPRQPCKVHYDFWYGIPTNGNDFHVDPREFYDTRWLSITDARKLVTDPPNLEALKNTEDIFAKALNEVIIN
jgi:8-oxo-dGTP pyrophosphatase MutT (NUDIX family)